MHETMNRARKLAEEILAARHRDEMDYHRYTAPCGLPCFECYLFLANENPELKNLISKVICIPEEKAVCQGCRDNEGKVNHLPMPCRLYPCVREKGLERCDQCADFPCDLLHPYQDMAYLWHNTKVFNLCLIKKMGLEEWAGKKAGSVQNTYSYGKWTL